MQAHVGATAPPSADGPAPLEGEEEKQSHTLEHKSSRDSCWSSDGLSPRSLFLKHHRRGSAPSILSPSATVDELINEEEFLIPSPHPLGTLDLEPSKPSRRRSWPSRRQSWPNKGQPALTIDTAVRRQKWSVGGALGNGLMMSPLSKEMSTFEMFPTFRAGTKDQAETDRTAAPSTAQALSVTTAAAPNEQVYEVESKVPDTPDYVPRPASSAQPAALASQSGEQEWAKAAGVHAGAHGYVAYSTARQHLTVENSAAARAAHNTNLPANSDPKMIALQMQQLQLQQLQLQQLHLQQQLHNMGASRSMPVRQPGPVMFPYMMQMPTSPVHMPMQGGLSYGQHPMQQAADYVSSMYNQAQMYVPPGMAAAGDMSRGSWDAYVQPQSDKRGTGGSHRRSQRHRRGTSRRHADNSTPSFSHSNSFASKRQAGVGSGVSPRSARGQRRGSTGSPMFHIDLGAIRNGTELRRTVMVRNIPNKFDRDTLLEHFSAYQQAIDFFYLPMDLANECNVGYAFVNFTNEDVLIDFYQRYHNKGWNVFKSSKVCVVAFARLQGLEALVTQFTGRVSRIDIPDRYKALRRDNANGQLGKFRIIVSESAPGGWERSGHRAR